MATNTPNLGLLKKDPATDGAENFNIQTMLNDNWDKIDTAVAGKQKTITVAATAPVTPAANDIWIDISVLTAPKTKAYISGQWVVMDAQNADTLDGSHASAFATAVQGTKADAALPSANYTAADVLTKIKTVDGAASGLDADLLDGLHATAFATAAQGTKADAALPSANYTAADVLAKLLTVDGTGTGIDADLLDGKHAADFLLATIYTAADILTKIKTVDGAASGLDADLLDGNHASAFLLATAYTAADVLTKLLTVDGTGTGLDADLLDGKHAADFLLATAYTAADVLAKLLTVDGSGTGIDADLLDGKQAAEFLLLAGGIMSGALTVNNTVTAQRLISNIATGTAPLTVTSTTAVTNLNADLLDGNHSSAFATAAQGTKADDALPAANYTASDVLTKIKTVDGSGSGLDADLLDGLDSTAFQKAMAMGSGTIPTTGWVSSGETDYTLKVNVAISGTLTTDYVMVDIANDSIDVAQAAELSPNVTEYAGGITFYCKTTPTASIPFNYTRLR